MTPGEQDRVKDLEAENARLRKEVAELKRTLKAEYNYDNERLDMEIGREED